MIDRIILKIEKINDSLAIIQNHIPKSFEEFSKLGLIKDGIYKRLEYCIELLIDIIAIINSELKLGIPNSPTDSIQHLVSHKILDSHTADLFISMKAFRNISVHICGEMNDEIAFEIITEKLDDFTTITDKILEYIKKIH